MANSEKTTYSLTTCLIRYRWFTLFAFVIITILIYSLVVHCIHSFSPDERAKSIKSRWNIGSSIASLDVESETYYYQQKPSEMGDYRPAEVQPENRSKENLKGQVVSDRINLALNKPVVELFLNVKKIKPLDEDLKTDSYSLQFDPRRLSSYLRYYEQYTVNAGMYPSHLTDGDYNTAAAPADFVFDYIVDLKGKYSLSEIIIDWGSSGVSVGSQNYITEWELYGQDLFSGKTFPRMEDWHLIIKGGIPGQRITKIPEQYFKEPVARLRIKARSEAKDNRRANWIGIHEMEVYGTRLES